MSHRAGNLNIAPMPSSAIRCAPASSSPDQTRPILRRLFDALEMKRIRYCHWKSNIRLNETLTGVEDVDLLIDRRRALDFHSILFDIGFKLVQSRAGIGHPGVVHALAIDETQASLLHLHIYFQIVSGDSLVKNYRFAIEDGLLDQTRMLSGVRVPVPEAELVVFAIRAALKHADLIELLIARRDAGKIADEMAWLRNSARMDVSTRLCAEWFPELDPALFLNVVSAFADLEATTWTRVVLGRRVAHALRDRRRYRSIGALFRRMHHVAALLRGRMRRRRDLVPQTGGLVVAFVGPKATGKSTLTSALAKCFGLHLDIVRLHVGKPAPTAFTWIAHKLVPIARWLYPNESSGAYENSERRREKNYSLLFTIRSALLAHDRRILLRRAQRIAAGGGLVICDRYPATTIGAIDSSCFDDIAIEKSGSHLKRWLMLWERATYQSMPRPNLVIRLIAPIETTIYRDMARVKESGPNADAVRRRWALERNAEFATNVITVETDRPLNETVATVVRAVWMAL
jgi:thymidylate kinase